MLPLRSFLQQYRQNIVMRVMLIVIEISRMIANIADTQNGVVVYVVKGLFVVVVVVVVVITGVEEVEGMLGSVPVTLTVGVVVIVPE